MIALVAVGLISASHTSAHAQVSKPNESKPKERVKPRPARNVVLSEIAIEGVGTDATQITLPELPRRQWKVSLKDLGTARPIALRGVESEASVGVGVRRDE
ncbi:MAG: cellulose biosynthesis cyclic di-GMP-binding regulatory protein BcsB, partial [Gammaproteobacteria bacterium]|nr:cellulose biosynthesis cyclic di-GMP-binding regulatory protein BcsB [Gammaproteobacteria bacterium]